MEDFQKYSTDDIIKVKGIIFWINLIESEGINNLNDCSKILKQFTNILLEMKLGMSLKASRDDGSLNKYEDNQLDRNNEEMNQMENEYFDHKNIFLETVKDDHLSDKSEVKFENNFINPDCNKIIEVDSQIKYKKSESNEIVKGSQFDYENILKTENVKHTIQFESKINIIDHKESLDVSNHKTVNIVRLNEEKYNVNELAEKKDSSYRITEFNKNVQYRLHACDYCPYKSSRFHVLKRHIRDTHNESYEIFLIFHNLLLKYKCEFCEEKCKTVMLKTKHVENSHPEKWNEYEGKLKTHKCDQCDRKFFTTVRLKCHMRKVHKKYNSIKLADGTRKRIRTATINDGLHVKGKRKCHLCEKVLPNATYFTDHLAVHEKGPNPYSCDKCEYNCNKRRKLTKHVRSHDQSQVLCDPCGKIFQSQFDFNKHTKASHKPAKIYKKLSSKVRNEPKGDFACKTCGKTFSEQTKLRRHKKSVHMDVSNMLSCDKCEYKAKEKNALKRHKLLHLPPSIKCDECEAFFNTRTYLLRHKLKKHSLITDFPFQCGKCEKGFIDRPIYEGHVNMHLGLKPEKCRYCEKVYQNGSNCLNHEKKAHKDIFVKRVRKIRSDFR